MKTSRYIEFSRYLATLSGRAITFMMALLLIVGWALTGPLFDYSDTWQLVINTTTSVVTFLMVFLIQNTQNRDTEAIQIKLDELIRATHGAHNELLNLESLDERQLEEFRKKYERLAAKAKKLLKSGAVDTDSPELDNRRRK
ncbi:MAG: low affinity iron permease family protein [Gammaproteobacteria bacterium]|nr:low affinity iron permease family protein [Gammaproteobacteria bacterium]